MSTLKLLTIYLLGLCLVAGVRVSAASGKAKTLTLYEEGSPVPNGSKLEVEISELCAGSKPEAWHLPARLTAAGGSPVVVSIEPPGTVRCIYEFIHSSEWKAELKEVWLVAARKGMATVLGRLLREPGDPEHPYCEYEVNNPTGRFPLRGEAEIKVKKAVGREVAQRTCRSRVVRFERGMIVTLRGHNGKPLQTRFS
jgi:hypothetical protein